MLRKTLIIDFLFELLRSKQMFKSSALLKNSFSTKIDSKMTKTHSYTLKLEIVVPSPYIIIKCFAKYV